ncbi:MAG: hypothetical protein KFF73_15830 [Cyclobacteriaceae bacterium]|nr:hypothetical protein [Cyclobacteriaceae bacterium]
MLDIKVQGSGCMNCKKLEILFNEVIRENEIPTKKYFIPEDELVRVLKTKGVN